MIKEKNFRKEELLEKYIIKMLYEQYNERFEKSI